MRIYILFIVLFTFKIGYTQNLNTYEIEKLTKPKKYLREMSKEDFLINEKSLTYGRYLIENSSELPDSIVSYGENPFLNGIVRAYQDHRPYTISPDIVWLLISQGFSRHISFNSEKYRGNLVNFEDKKTLSIEARDYIELGNPNSDWNKAFYQLTEQTKKYIEPKLIDVLTANFSTSTKISLSVSQITILEAFKGYFNYEIDGRGCGIPKIIIEGTLKDWEKVLEKTEYISKYELSWWTDKLTVILKEIIKTKKGNFDKTFWINMVKFHSAEDYGAKSEITGWVVDFYPYLSDGKRTDFKPISDTSSLPSEFVQVPFVFTDSEIGLKLNMKIKAGFIGLTQSKDYTLKPEIGWFVTYKNPKEK